MFNWNAQAMGGQRFPMPQQPMVPFAQPSQMPAIPGGGGMPFQQWMPGQGAQVHPPAGVMMGHPAWPPVPQTMIPTSGNMMGVFRPMAPFQSPAEDKPPLPAEPPPPLPPNSQDKPPLPPVETVEPSPKKTPPRPPPDPAVLAELERVEKEEQVFTEQYNDWKKQYDDWREQNESHPNKEQYHQYLDQWKTYEKQMEARKENILSEKEELLKKLKETSKIVQSPPSGGSRPSKPTSQGQPLSSPHQETGPNRASHADEEEKGEEDMNIDDEDSNVGGIIESTNAQPGDHSWQPGDNQLNKGNDFHVSSSQGNQGPWDYNRSQGTTSGAMSEQKDSQSFADKTDPSLSRGFQQGGHPNPDQGNFDADAPDSVKDFDDIHGGGFGQANYPRGRGADRGFPFNRGGRGSFERGRGGFDRGRGGFGGSAEHAEGDREGYDDGASFYEGVGFNRGRGGFDGERGRGGFNAARGGRGGYEGRGGHSGGFEERSGEHEGEGGGYEDVRGGHEGGRGGRGGFDRGRGGFYGSRGGFEGGRGGFEGGRGGFEGGRGGFEGSRGGFEGGRGGFEGGRGGFEGGRGGFEGGRGGFEGGRGGFEGGRGGFEGGRGGFEGGRGGFEGGRGGFEGGRGGFEGGRGDFEGGRGGFEGGRDSFEGGRDSFEGGRGGRGGFERGRGRGSRGGRGQGGFEETGAYEERKDGFEGEREGLEGRGGFERGRGGFKGGRGGFEGGIGGSEGGRGGSEGGGGGPEGGRGGFEGGRGGFEGGRGGFEGGRGGFEGGRGGFEGGRGGFEGGRGGFEGGRGGFEGGRGGFEGGRGGFERGRGGFEGGRGGLEGGRGGFEGGRGGFERGRGGLGGGRGGYEAGRGGFERGRGGRGGFDGGRGGFESGRSDFEGTGTSFEQSEVFEGSQNEFGNGRGGFDRGRGGRGGFDRGRGNSEGQRGRGGFHGGIGGFDNAAGEEWNDFEGASSGFGESRGRFQRGRAGPLQGPGRGRARGSHERGRGNFQMGRGRYEGNWGNLDEDWHDSTNQNQEGFNEDPYGRQNQPEARGGHYGQRGRRPSGQQEFEEHSEFGKGADHSRFDDGYGPNQRGQRSRGGPHRGGGMRGAWSGIQGGPDSQADSRGPEGFGSERQNFPESTPDWRHQSRDGQGDGFRAQDFNYSEEGPEMKRGRFEFDESRRDNDRRYPPLDEFGRPLDPYRHYPDPYLRDPYYDPRDPYYPSPPHPAPYRYDPYDRYGDWGERMDPHFDGRPPPMSDTPYPEADKIEKASAAQPAEVIDYGHGQSSKDNLEDTGSKQDTAQERSQDPYFRGREGNVERGLDSSSQSGHQLRTQVYDHGHTKREEELDPWRSGAASSDPTKPSNSDYERERERPMSPASFYRREREDREKAGFNRDSRGQQERDNVREGSHDSRNRERELEASRRDERYRDRMRDDRDFDGRTNSRYYDPSRSSGRDHDDLFPVRRRSREREIEGSRRGERPYGDRQERDTDERFDRRGYDTRNLNSTGEGRIDARDVDHRFPDQKPVGPGDRGSSRREESRFGRRDEWDSPRFSDRQEKEKFDDRDTQRRDFHERYRGESDPLRRNEAGRSRDSERWQSNRDHNEPLIPRRGERTGDGRYADPLRDQYSGSFSPDVRGTPPLIGKSPAPSSSSLKKNEIVKIEDLLCPPGRNSRPPQLVTIIRGLPGSGKTYVSKLLREKEMSYGGHPPRMLCLDDYFMIEVDKTEKDPETGKTIRKKVLEYEYEQDLEDSYRQSLLKSFKKTIDDGFFPFIIVDATNERISHFSEFWSYAKSKGFQVYVGELNADVSTCINRNIHRWTEWDIEKVKGNWEGLPLHYIRLDLRWLLQEDSIPEVVMEDTVDDEEPKEKDEDEEENSEEIGLIYKKSKWELDTSEETLDKLDGIRVSKKHIEEHQSMDDYLQLDQMDDDYFTRESVPGKKRVRWADLEEKKNQSRRRDLGFIVGQTQRDWDRITDDDFAEKALNQTKYFYK